ncbi:unnamed protein product [Tilletia controversa]|nr:unnamed protein product [Tilletia controversa]
MLALRLLPLTVLLFGEVSANLHSQSFCVHLKRQWTDACPPLNGEPLSNKQIKPEWKAALDAAIKAGKIPNIPPSSSDGGTPTYPAVASCGTVSDSFIADPTQSIPRLKQFLLKNHISATRFLTGGQVAGMTSAFKDIIKDPSPQLAVHTYTHQQMTVGLAVFISLYFVTTSTLSGDVDNRVRAIAEGLFGLRHINALAGPKAPGVLMLEHELSDTAVGFFEEHTWTGIQKKGWKHANVAEMLGLPWYTNAVLSKGPKTTPTSVLKVVGINATDAVADKNGTAATGGASGTAASGAAAGSKHAGSTAGASTASTTGVKKLSASSMVATSGAAGLAIVALAAAICAMLI